MPSRHPELPLDPDLAVDDAPGTHPYRDPAALGLAFVGGTLGTAAREAASLAFPAVDGVPYATLAVNLLGAFLLGVLLESLARRGPDHGRNRRLRLLLGTGFMGGFTTYSALATDYALLLGDGRVGAGLGYAVATVLVGAVATWCGIAVGGALGGASGGNARNGSATPEPPDGPGSGSDSGSRPGDGGDGR